MSKTSLRLKLAKMLLKFATIETDKGTLNMEGELSVGIEVYTEDNDGNMTPATDGEYVMEDGRTLVVAEGKVTEIREAAPETVDEAMEGETETGDTGTDTNVETPDYEEIINTLLTAVEELTARVDSLTADVAELKKDTVEEEIDDQFSKKTPKKAPKKCWERI